MATKARRDDLFAKIAAQGTEANRGMLIEPQPPTLPTRSGRCLQWVEDDGWG